MILAQAVLRFVIHWARLFGREVEFQKVKKRMQLLVLDICILLLERGREAICVGRLGPLQEGD